ncbi:RiPP maturation radical SAM C-methyltransferase [Mechercharimyces sp. CAU 1602]|uniref:RiPP maturation radical SAM C-methyltransferase n=1 Tax=Mechercharimyces sp. CAU 1602 TaxID=2973933 RepID=UPI0021611155|nr:RiPP maturation radical SAM C-methyltransferase [Mechercharimyces sp. CAU 1602]MCS1351096.1 RiPP maturation radical SAM C-methyltransferase [Mechercharimyces sp. CAU 1602]
MHIALVNMPFASLGRPSIGIGLLKSQVEQHGHTCKNHYLNLHLIDYIGITTYRRLSATLPSLLLGEWIFSSSLRPSSREDDLAYLKLVNERIGDTRGSWCESENLLRMKELMPRYLDDCLQNVDWEQYDLVGFTSVFEQNLASLGMAQRIKQKWPHIKIVMGGANCEGPMGVAMIKAFSFLDFVCQGEGDLSLPTLLKRMECGETTEDIPGILTPTNLDHKFSHKANMMTDLDQLPYPDYNDYFDGFEKIGLDSFLRPSIPFETSRGCWWGEKSHCTFCGLNGLNMRFRSKDADRAIDEIVYLLKRYQKHTTSMAAVDNIIDYKYFQDFIPRLIELDLGIDLFYETKANIKRDQLEAIKKAGFTSIQPGIESLITDVLKRMRKGITMLQNVRLLKWCEEFGIVPSWNILYGFPGEDPADYQYVAEEIISKLVHYHPPICCAPFRLDRFSPYFDFSDQFGIINIRHNRSYRYLYPQLSKAERFQIAYYFEFDYDDQRNPSEYADQLKKKIDRWSGRYDSSFFCYIQIEDRIRFFDNRTQEDGEISELSGWKAKLYQSTDDIKTAKSLLQEMTKQGWKVSLEELTAALQEFVDRGWMLHEERRYLALAIPEGIYEIPEEMKELLLTQKGEGVLQE